MNKNLFLLIISIFEIIRWVLIYFFLNFAKSNLGQDTKIVNEKFLWFGTTVFLSMLFAVSGILSYINSEKYLVVTKFWSIFKLFFIAFIIFLLFYGVMTLKTYFLLFAPFDFFIFLYLILFVKEYGKSKNIS